MRMDETTIRMIEKIGETDDLVFNAALDTLVNFHQIVDACGKPALVLNTRPGGIRSNKLWQIYLNALLTLTMIGTKKGWVEVIRDEHTRLTYAYILLDKIHEEK